jgi:hypothetical protein
MALGSAFIELLMLFLLLISLVRSDRQSYKAPKNYGLEPNLVSKQFPKHYSGIMKKEIAEFRRFLIILVILTVIGYIMVSNYLETRINVWTIIILVIGIILTSSFIFFKVVKRYT